MLEKRHYKWGPLDAPSRAAGLTDDSAISALTSRRRAGGASGRGRGPNFAPRSTAYRAGIDVTHLDAHMGAALAPEFCDIYHPARP